MQHKCVCISLNAVWCASAIVIESDTGQWHRRERGRTSERRTSVTTWWDSFADRSTFVGDMSKWWTPSSRAPSSPYTSVNSSSWTDVGTAPPSTLSLSSAKFTTPVWSTCHFIDACHRTRTDTSGLYTVLLSSRLIAATIAAIAETNASSRDRTVINRIYYWNLQ